MMQDTLHAPPVIILVKNVMMAQQTVALNALILLRE